MNAKLRKVKRVSVLVCCVSLLFGAAAGGGAAEGETSILERVTAIHDPELGELIRQALANSPELANDQTAKAALAKRVTEAYLQIKMLDGQIAETDKRIESPRTTEAIRTELMLVRMELETKLETQLAELRETMKLIPEAKYQRPVNVLNTWLALDVIGGNFVCVYRYSEPYYEREHHKSKCEVVGVKSGAEVIAHARDLIESKEHFPLRLDIFRNADGRKLSEELKKQIDQIVQDAKLDMNPVEVYLVGGARGNVKVVDFVLRQGTKAFWRNNPEKIEPPEHFLRFITDLCQAPRQLPLRVYVEFDEESKDVATKMAEGVRQVARELGVKGFVNITLLSGSFGQRKPVETLNSWLALDVIGEDAVYVFEHSKPHHELVGDWPSVSPVRLMSQDEMVAHVRHLTENKEKLPLRVDISRNEAGSKLSEEIYEHIVRIVRNANLEAEAEVNLYGERHPAGAGGWRETFVLKQGKWYYAAIDFSSVSEKAHDFDLPGFKHPISYPGFLPYDLHIKFNLEGKELAKHIAEGLQKAARDLGIEQFVNIKAQPAYLNSWLALGVIADDVVRVFRYSKPFYLPHQGWTESECEPVKIISQAEAIAYVKDFLKSKEQLPLIVDISRNKAGSKSSEEINRQITQMVDDTDLQDEVEVYLGGWEPMHIEEMTLKHGKIVSWMGEEGSWDEEYFSNWITGTFVNLLIKRPGHVPRRYPITFDEESRTFATKISKAIQKAAREFGVEQFVNITLLSGSFGQRRPVRELNSWLALNVIGDDVVYVFNATRPVGLKSQAETIAYVRDLAKSKDKLPLRVDISRNETGSEPSEELFKEIVRMAKDAKVDTELEVYLDGGVRPSVTKKGFVLKNRKGYEAYVRRGRADLTADEQAHEVLHDAGWLMWFCTTPIREASLPHEIYLAFDHESKDLAERMLEEIRKTARELGVEQFVKIKLDEIEELKESEP